MGQYNYAGTSSTTDPNNLILLRRNIHFNFNRKDFALVPKCGKSVVHYLSFKDPTTIAFHNRETGNLAICKQVAFARFAYTLFPLHLEVADKLQIAIHDPAASQFRHQELSWREVSLWTGTARGTKRVCRGEG